MFNMIKNKIADIDWQLIECLKFSNSYKMSRDFKKHCKSSN